MKQIEFIRKKDLLRQLSYSNSTLYRRIKEGIFPPSVKISTNVHAWIKEEVATVMAKMGSGATPQELARVVNDLVENRCNGEEACSDE